MVNEEVRRFIADLPIDFTPSENEDSGYTNSTDINDLPRGIVSGTNLIQFPEDASPELKSSVALSLLAAQRYASHFVSGKSPSEWIGKHNDALKNLNWIFEEGSSGTQHFNSVDVSVHEAIIPFLTAVFGNVAGAGALIIAALKQLKDMDKKSPWITLFGKQDPKLDETENQFTVVYVDGATVHLKLAAIRFNTSFGRTQVLFFNLKKQDATFEQATQSYAALASSLIEMNDDLKAKMRSMTKSFIQSLPDDLLVGAPDSANELAGEKLPE